jgi:hypothetical protein
VSADRPGDCLELLPKLDIPIRKIKKVLPAVVVAPGKADVHKGPPLRTLWFSNEVNPGLVRKPVALSRVTWDAGANNILPGRLATPISRKDVIKIQFVPLKNLAAILTRVSVAFEHVVSRKLDFLLRQSLEKQQHNDPWNTNAHRNRADHLRLGIGLRKIPPAGKIVRQIVVRPIGGNHLGMPLVKERKGSSHRTGINGLPEAI